MSMAVRELLAMGQRTLEGVGVEEAKAHAEALFCHMLNIDKNGFFMYWSKDLEDEQCNSYFRLIDIRAARIPLQHITGNQAFMGHIFDIDKDVLIPRLDTECVAEKAIEYINEQQKKCSVLDLCCGSGILGISIAKACQKVDVTCADISKKAVELTKKNAKKLKADIHVKEGDMLTPFKKRLGNSKFDVIVSNPPYIETDTIKTLEEEVCKHEPFLALDGGPDGLDFYKLIFSEVGAHLKKGGTLILEIGHNQGEAVKNLADSCGLFEHVEVFNDYADKERIVVCKTVHKEQ